MSLYAIPQSVHFLPLQQSLLRICTIAKVRSELPRTLRNHCMVMMCRLLSPEQDSSSAMFVGNFVTQLIMQLAERVAPHIRDLIAALVNLMQSTDAATLKTTLLLVFARLVIEIYYPSFEQITSFLIC